MAKTIMLIHGAWLSPACWDRFKSRYEAMGLTVLAPAWPFDDRPIAQLRAHPRPALATLTIEQIVDHYAGLIGRMEEPPILIGHSFGGLFVQLLLDRGLGAAGVAIDPAAPKGVPPSLSALWGALPVFLKWRGWQRTLTLTLRQFSWAFVQTEPSAQQQRYFRDYLVPTPGRLYYQSAAGIQTEVNFTNPRRAPLLLISGDQDRTVTPRMVEKVYRKHLASGAVTDFKQFAGRPHLLIATPGWEEVADHALHWALRHSNRNAVTGDLAAVA